MSCRCFFCLPRPATEQHSLAGLVIFARRLSSIACVSMVNLKSKVVLDPVLEFATLIATGVSPDGIGKPWASQGA